MKSYIDAQPKSIQLCHIDAVPDNFLFVTGKDGSEEIKLTDWEYAGMQDPHLDVAMFIIYAMYDRDSAEKLIDLYFSDGCDKATRLKIYCYIAVSGLVWSNWCEFKRHCGVEFGAYAHVVGSYADFVERHRTNMGHRPVFSTYWADKSDAEKEEMKAALEDGIGYDR